jgi:hypothetical protein
VVCSDIDHIEVTLTSKDLGGGIVKSAENSQPQVQPIGSGMTVYYWVDDLDKAFLAPRSLGKACAN